MIIRQPIVTVLGHVDSGKTTLLDSIRGSFVAKGEAGLITQHIGASEIPIENIKNICGKLFEKMKVDVKIPGLLIIDSPGHEAFTTLRKRGGSIADLVILVIDIHEGFQPQTDESLRFLKEFKTPFVVAATKIDRILGWRSEHKCFVENFAEQDKRAQDEFEEKLYRLVGQFGERGFNAERFDRIQDFAKEICIVPVSGVTGEGVPDLLTILTGLSQKYLEKRLEVNMEEGKGTILEVKHCRGLGTSIDVIIYDGVIRKGDYLVIGGKEITVARVKSLLKPEPLKELRVEKKFIPVDQVSAASGVKISASDLDNVIAGSPLRAVNSEEGIEKAKLEVQKEIEEVEIETQKDGAVLKADTLGSLEALIKILGEMQIPIRKAEVGNVTKGDVTEISSLEEPIIFAFNIDLLPDVETLAKDHNVRIFSSNVIYKIIEDYKDWQKEKKKLKEQHLLDTVTRPGKIKILPGYVFRQSKPAVFGVEVLAGTIKPGYKLKKDGKIVGEIKELQLEGKNVHEAKAGDKLAVSMEDVVVGRHVDEGDILETELETKDLEILGKIKSKLRSDEKELLEEYKA